ncbi:MAG: pilus assembly protein PilY [Comamonas sp.]|nr:pilus assembly protein PilY [Comamonas sp.]
MQKKYLFSFFIISVLFFTPKSNTQAQSGFIKPNDANIHPVNLSADPLYSQGSGHKPTLTLALSVEYPTVGAQYRNSFSENTEYPGYFDSKSCYNYTKNSDAAQRYFMRIGATASTTKFECNGNGFSGNFMNWASSSSIDILRLGLTGGDRIIDTESLTVLQRAVLMTSFFNDSSVFPQKKVPAVIAKKYLPNSMFSSNSVASNKEVRISNCLDRIYFFVNGSNSLATGSSGCQDIPPYFYENKGTPSNPENTNFETHSGKNLDQTKYKFCAADGSNSTCVINEPVEMLFGTANKWISFYTNTSMPCYWSILGDPASGQGKSCYIRKISSVPELTKDVATTATGNFTTNSDNFYYTRSRVCESTNSSLTDPRTQLCQRYPSGNYKPIGNLQKYSDRLRVAAFGYLMDSGTARYGGVLRNPMTYVGPRNYDENGQYLTTQNPYLEWNTSTGVFNINPRKTADGKSGVINYLNTFGRTGTYGMYKSNDPLGELYYESLRYLQGLSPTPQAYSGVSADGILDTKKDGFPVYTTWTDPFAGISASGNYSCLRNSILTIADKNTHADKSLPGNDRTSNNDFARSADNSANLPDFKFWTKVIGGFESGTEVSYTDGSGNSRKTPIRTENIKTNLENIHTADTGAGQAAYYIAGAAYWANTHDIRGSQWSESSKRRPGLRVKTYVLDVNEGSASDIDSTRWNSQLFITAKYGGYSYSSDDSGNPFSAQNRWNKDAQPTEAKTYFLASDAQAVLTALNDIFIAVTQASTSIAKPALSSSQLTTTDSYIYQTDFNPEYWSGDVRRRSLSSTSTDAIIMGSLDSAVSAANKLDALSTSALNSRNIIIGKSTKITEPIATEFKWDSLEDGTKAFLNQADPIESPQALPDNLGEKRLEYIRGHRNYESNPFRNRSSRLGDIVNSGVVYSGAPTTRYSDTSYKEFYENNKNRTKAIFVGANDGMLHAFNAESMEEIFAYIPSWLSPKLSRLTSSDYNSSRHTAYVDATPTVAEAQLGNNWKTVLVSGTGAGGQGVFALDVTNPRQFSKDKVLWEFTDADDASLGNVVGQPKIFKFRTSAPESKSISYKWFAVVAGGINNYMHDGINNYSTTGEPALFLLDLSKSKTASWQLGVNYFKITTPIFKNLADQTADSNGTAIPSGIINFDATSNIDGSIQYIYFGDLHGQMWKLDMAEANFSSSSESAWNLAKLSYFKKSGSPKPLFVARTSSSTTAPIQPISMVPSIAHGPNQSYIISFGTGKYLEASDNLVNNAIKKESFYVLYDLPESTLDTAGTGDSARIRNRDRLQAASISGNAISAAKFIWSKPTDAQNTPVNKKSGWYIDYPLSGSSGGEKQITQAVLFGKNIYFNSILPPTATTNACGGGSSRSYVAELASGIGTVSALTNGALGAPILLNLSSKYSASGSTGDRIRTDRAGIYNPSSTGKTEPYEIQEAYSLTGRISWRQIHNYQELRRKFNVNQ